jgi:hypothetical protein
MVENYCSFSMFQISFLCLLKAAAAWSFYDLFDIGCHHSTHGEFVMDGYA